MNEIDLRSRVVATATSWLGRNGNDGSHREIIDLYNTQRPLPRGVTMTYNMPWCATFATAVFIKAELADLLPGECSVPEMVKLVKKADIWVEDDAHRPKLGDLIIYNWADNTNYALTDNTGNPDHVGVVVEVGATSIKVIEGNKGNAVAFRQVPINGRYIRGFIAPKFSEKAEEITKAEANTPAAWARTSWEKAKAAGVMDGTRPYEPITRQEVAVILDRTGNLK